MYSDAAVHFTPEFMSLQSWQHDVTPDIVNVSLWHFESSQEEIVRAFADLTASHILVLRVFDECYDNAFRTSREWVQQLNHINAMGLSFVKTTKESAEGEPPPQQE
jgi:hypothetical protein